VFPAPGLRRTAPRPLDGRTYAFVGNEISGTNTIWQIRAPLR
jgi:hypothetical protein